MGKDYLVEGAQLICVNGSNLSMLKIPGGHGYTSGGKKKANCTDCKECANIPYFGCCKKNEKTHLCEGYMKLADKWESLGSSGTTAEKVNGENALTMDSVLLCRKGGVIIPLTSGQGYGKGIDWDAFTRRFQKVVRWVAGKNLMYQVFGGDPINMDTGNFIYEKEELKTAGIAQMSFHLFYNAMERDKGGCLGEGWHHNYEMYIREEDGGKLLQLCLKDGREIPYRIAVGDVYAPVLGDRGLLKREGETLLYRTAEGTDYMFDRQGRLTLKKDSDGNGQTLFYNGSGQLIRVEGTGGGKLFYNYNREGKLTTVGDHTGREVRLEYRYGKLSRYVNPSGYAYTYAYNVNGKLESVTTPRGIVGVKNEYDAADRVVRQEMPDGGVIELFYDDRKGRTYKKEQNGNMVIYESDDRFRNVRTVYEDGEEVYEYNDNNQKTLFVDKNGNKTSYCYDERGKLTGVRDPLGTLRSFTYDGAGRLLTICVESSKVWTNTYDEAGNLVKTADALGRSREIICNEKGQPEQILLPDKSRLHIAYDARGNIQSITDPYGSTVNYEYDDLNRVTATADGEDNRTQYVYDERDHLLAVTNPEGNTRRYVYNESGKPVRIQDFDGGALTVSYDAMGKPERLTDKEGRTVKRSYDLMGNLAEETVPGGAVFSYRYDKGGRLVRIEMREDAEAEEARTVYSYDYDPAGNVLRISAGDGGETLSETFYEYDALNRVTAVTNPVGGRTCYTYDRTTGKVDSITDPAGNKRFFHYNEAGELTKETDARGNETRYEYNSLGKLCTVTDGAGRITRHIYQSGGRLIRSVYPDGRQMDYEYDRLGRISARTDRQGCRLSYDYDSMGRVTCVSSSEGQKKSYTYDALGNIISMTDAEGNVTQYAYTLSGKLREVTDALGNRTEYAYDEADQLVRVCQHGRNGEADRTTAYERDPFGLVECARDALGGQECYLYDALGRMTEKMDREGLRTRYAYTPDNKVEAILYGDGRKAEFEYTHLRQLSMVKDWLGETRIERNAEGKPVRITNHAGETVSYEWGRFGERTAMTYPDGTVMSCRYDELLRLAQMERHGKGRGTLRITYRYDEAGRLMEKRNSGGYCAKWRYNALNQPEELIHEDGMGLLDQYQYTYDALGNKSYISKERRGLPEESGCYGYRYDALGRLTSVEKDGALLRSYGYDSFGNRISMEDCGKGIQRAYTYDALNRLVKEEIEGHGSLFSDAEGLEARRQQGSMGRLTGKSYTYDQRGNLTGEYQDGELLHGYMFNAMNRMEKAWDSTGREALYFYNGLGQRTGRETDGSQESYLLDLTKSYHNLLTAKSGDRKQNFYWDFGVAAMEEMDRMPRYYLQDELGSPIRVLYESGKGDVYGYDEFGEDLYNPEKKYSYETQYSRQGGEQLFGYTGYRYDNVSGTYFAQAREYRSGLGRFMAEDVINGIMIVPRTLNRYSYCWENPLSFVDYNGMSPVKVDTISNSYNDLIGLVDKISDSFIEFVNDVVQNTEKNLAEVDFTYSKGFNLSFTPSIWQLDGNLGWAVDSKGNFGIQGTFNGGVTVGTTSLTGSKYLSISNAPTIYDLEGPGTSIGGSAAIPIYGVPLSLGGEFNIIGDVNSNAQKYYGLSFLAGSGLAKGGEGHVEWGNTTTFFSFNLFEVWDNLYNNYKNKKLKESCESIE